MTERDNNQAEIVVTVDEDLEELIPGFLLNRRNDVIIINEALTKGDYETLRITGHSMKGSGGGYGFEAISRIGADIEKAAKESRDEDIRPLVKELEDYLGRIRIIYE